MASATLTGRLIFVLALQLLTLTGCYAVTVDEVRIEGRYDYAQVQQNHSTVLLCNYTLVPGETLEEVFWGVEGNVLQSYKPTNSSPVDTEVTEVNKFELSVIRREDAGLYSCTVWTAEGADSIGVYELFVIDMPLDGQFTSATSLKNCHGFISWETPPAYPDMDTFCGVWVNATSEDGQLGYWLEPPPEHNVTTEVLLNGARDSDSEFQLSFSTERGDFIKKTYEDGLTGFQLEEGEIDFDATPEFSGIRCYSGFYKNSGAYIEQVSSSTEFQNPKDLCSNTTLLEYTSAFVTLDYDNDIEACRGELRPPNPSVNLTATLTCTVDTSNREFLCQEFDWTMKKDGGFVVDFDEELRQFVQECAGGVTDPDDGGAGHLTAGAATLLLAFSSIILQLQSLHN